MPSPHMCPHAARLTQGKIVAMNMPKGTGLVMQILVVGNGNYKHRGAWYYDVVRKLINGFTRNGHNTYLLSDRDVSREATIFRARKLGIGHCNRVFLDVCRNFAPDLIVLCHAFIIRNDTLKEARSILPGVRIAQINVDPIFDPYISSEIGRTAKMCDATFVTTAGPILKTFSQPKGAVSYIPNMVDASIDWPRCHERSDQRSDVFWAMRPKATPNQDDPRIVLPLYLAANGIAIDYHGINGRPSINGASYYKRLADSKMGLNISLSRHSTSPEAGAEYRYLYTSDRISQYMGSGLLTLALRVNRLEEMFAEDKEIVYFDTKEELLEKVLYYKDHDAERRAIAKGGWEKSHTQLNERLVTKYMTEVTFRQPLSEPYCWPTQVY